MKKKKPGPLKGKRHTDIKRSAFGERLYKTRKIRHLSQTELGERVGLSRRMISHYEGDAPEGPPITTLKKMAEALNVSVSYLLGESTLKTIKEDINPNLKKYFIAFQNLPRKERITIQNMIEIAVEKNKQQKNE
jgi:transcriptional regulator with XRE-family HTH domain